MSTDNNSGWTLVLGNKKQMRQQKKRVAGEWLGAGEEETRPPRYDSDEEEYRIPHQDWRPVTLKSKAPPVAKVTKSSVTSKGVNRRPLTSGLDSNQARKLEEMETAGKAKRLSIETCQEVMKRRMALGWNQVQLNQQCGFPANTMREIEAGRVCPTPQMLDILNRVLKASLKYTS